VHGWRGKPDLFFEALDFVIHTLHLNPYVLLI